MKKLSIAAALLGGGAALYLASGGSTGKSALEFTKPAPPPAATFDLRPGLSTVSVALPVDLAPLAKQVDATLPEQLATVRDWLPDAACAQRGGVRGYECNAAKLEGTVTRNGPVELKVEPNGLRLVVPVKYALSATGIGWASTLTESKSGETTTGVSFAVAFGPNNALDVTVHDDTANRAAGIALLKGAVNIGRLIEPRVKPAMKSAEADLRRSLAALPIKAAVNRVWSILSAPVELGEGAGLWLKSAPDYYTTGQFAEVGGRLSYQMSIAARVAVVEGKRTMAGATKRQPIRSLDSPPVRATVRLALPIDLEAIRQAVETTFVTEQVLESRVDRFTDPVKVKVRGTRVYPALRQIGLELDVEATSNKGKTYAGKLNLVGRPVIDVAGGTVTLTDVTFPIVATRDASGRGVGPVSDMPRLGVEPFASMFAKSARLDVSRPLSEAPRRLAHLANRRIGDDLTLTGQFTEAIPVSFELAVDGAWLLIDVLGDVAFTYESTTEAAAAANMAGQTEGAALVATAPPVVALRPIAAAAGGAAIAAVALHGDGRAKHASQQGPSKPTTTARKPAPAARKTLVAKANPGSTPATVVAVQTPPKIAIVPVLR